MRDIRAFVAVRLDKKILDFMKQILEELANSGADVKWVHSQNLHITLSFLGNIEGGDSKAIKKTLKDVGVLFNRFTLAVKGVCAIPNNRFPRIISAEVVDKQNNLKKLSQLLEKKLEPLGFKKENREFFPHITLGRVKSFKAKTVLANKLREYHKKDFGEFKVENFFLMKSELKPKHAIYSDMASIALNKVEEQ